MRDFEGFCTVISHLYHSNRNEISFHNTADIWRVTVPHQTGTCSVCEIQCAVNVFRKILRVFMNYIGIILDVLSFSQKDGLVAAQLKSSEGEI